MFNARYRPNQWRMTRMDQCNRHQMTRCASPISGLPHVQCPIPAKPVAHDTHGPVQSPRNHEMHNWRREHAKKHSQVFLDSADHLQKVLNCFVCQRHTKILRQSTAGQLYFESLVQLGESHCTQIDEGHARDLAGLKRRRPCE